jgi:hypothetical protein
MRNLMRLCIWPVVRPELQDVKFETGGEVLFANYEALDKIARTAKLTSLMNFADNRPVPEDFDGDPDELDEVMGEWTEWFDPVKGRVAMQALADYIKSNSKAAKRFDDPQYVVNELQDIARILVAAEKKGAKFRLEVIM